MFASWSLSATINRLSPLILVPTREEATLGKIFRFVHQIMEGARLSGADDFPVRFAFVERWPFRTAFVAVDQFHVIDAHEVENGDMKIVNMKAIFDGMQSYFIGGADGLAT